MNEFETTFYFFDEERPCVVTWEACWGDVYISKVEIALLIHGNWTPQGKHKPGHVERRVMDVLEILSDAQALDLVKQIRAACAKARAEDYDDSRMMTWEEKNRRLLAA